MHSFEKLVDLGSAAPRVCVMCQNISGWLTVDCLIIYNVLPIVSHIFFRQKSTIFAYVLEVTVTLSPFAQTSFTNPLLYHQVYFLSFDFFFKQKTAYEIMPSLVGSEMCIRDRL